MKRSMLLFMIGSVCYPVIELLWRGHTHCSMAFAGGISLCFVDKTCRKKYRHPVSVLQCALCACIITMVEFITGFFVNIIGRRKVWDYSNLPANILGQVCLPFTIAWFFLSIPMIWLCRYCRNTKYFCK